MGSHLQGGGFPDRLKPYELEAVLAQGLREMKGAPADEIVAPRGDMAKADIPRERRAVGVGADVEIALLGAQEHPGFDADLGHSARQTGGDEFDPQRRGPI